MARRRGRRPRTPREQLIAHTMRRFKNRTLRSGTGRPGQHGAIVTRREQALAIALSKAKARFGPYIRKGRR